MNPPIPEPMSVPRAVERGPRPETMKYFMAGCLVSAVIGLVYCDGTLTEYSVAADLIVYATLTAIWLFVLRKLWHGHNWARITVMVWCVLSMLSIFMIGEYSALQQVATVADAVFSLALLCWLRTPAIVAFTKGKPI